MEEKRRLVLVLVLLLSLSLYFAFSIDGTEDIIGWNLTFDATGAPDVARGVAIDSNNYVYVVGEGFNLYSEPTSGADWWVKKFYENGTEFNTTAGWNKSIDGNSNTDQALGVAIDSNNNIYVVGTATNVYNTTSQNDWWVKKFNSTGHEFNITEGWNKTFDATGAGDIAYGVATDSNDNIYVVGVATNLVGAGTGSDWWIKKFNSSGHEFNTTEGWNKSYDGASGADIARAVAIDSNNDVYVVGQATNLVNGTSQNDWWIKKFNSSGTENISAWNKTFDGSGSSDIPYGIDIDSENNVYVIGDSTNLVSGTSGLDWWIKKFNSTGNETFTGWNRTFDGNSGADSPFGINIDLEDNVYVVGYATNIVSGSSGADWWVKRFNKTGYEFNATDGWNKTYDVDDSSDQARAVAVFSDNNVSVVGHATNAVSASSNQDWWLKKFEGSDRTAPSVNITNPTNNSNFSSSVQAFNATVTDTFSNVDQVIFVFSTNTTPFNRSATNISGNWNTNVDLSTVVEGTHIITVFANDTSNNINITQSITIIIDRTNPLVNITTPVNGTNLSSGTQAFNTTVQDLTARQVIFVFNNASGNDFNVTAANNSGNWHNNVDLSRFIESKSHNVTVFANDSLNNINYTESIWFTVDRTAPNVTIINTSFSTTSTTPVIYVNVTDNIFNQTSCSLYFSNSLSTTSTVINATLTGITASSLSTGTYATNVNCTDSSGNLGNSSVINVTITATSSSDSSSSGGSGGSGRSGGGGSLPVPEETTTEENPTEENSGNFLVEIIAETEELSQEEGETALVGSAIATPQTSTKPFTREKTVTVRFTNTKNNAITVLPTIKEFLPPLENENILQQKVGEQQLETLKRIEKENVNFITGRAVSFSKGTACRTFSGMQYSRDLITGDLLKPEILNPREITVLPNQTIEEDFNIRQGVSAKVGRDTLVFVSGEKEVAQKEIIAKREIGSTVSIDAKNHILDLYAQIPKQDNKARYMVEVNINQDEDSLLWQPKNLFGDLYGTYTSGAVFAQQFIYDPTCYQGKAILNAKIYKDNEVVSNNFFAINFNTGTVTPTGKTEPRIGIAGIVFLFLLFAGTIIFCLFLIRQVTVRKKPFVLKPIAYLTPKPVISKEEKELLEKEAKRKYLLKRREELKRQIAQLKAKRQQEVNFRTERFHKFKTELDEEHRKIVRK